MANRPRRNKKVQISLSQPLPNNSEPQEIFSHNPEETTEQPPEKEGPPPEKEGSPAGNDGEGSPTDPNPNSNRNPNPEQKKQVAKGLYDLEISVLPHKSPYILTSKLTIGLHILA